MREAGDVCFADVYKDGTGACEYVRYEDMKYALKKLDDTKFKSHEVSRNQPNAQLSLPRVHYFCQGIADYTVFILNHKMKFRREKRHTSV